VAASLAAVDGGGTRACDAEEQKRTARGDVWLGAAEQTCAHTVSGENRRRARQNGTAVRRLSYRSQAEGLQRRREFRPPPPTTAHYYRYIPAHPPSRLCLEGGLGDQTGALAWALGRAAARGGMNERDAERARRA